MTKKKTKTARVVADEARERERLVWLIQRSLNRPDATVTLDLKLPYTGTKRKRQFDVVIERPDAHGKLVTVVEVQKRGRKVESKDFDGWTTKLTRTGVNRLICVSEAGFSEPTIDEVAATFGGRVILLELRALEAGELPFDLLNPVLRYHQPLKSEVNGNVKISCDPRLSDEPSIRWRARQFSVNGTRCTLAQLLQETASDKNPAWVEEHQQTGCVTFNPGERRVVFHKGKVEHQVRSIVFPLTVKWKSEPMEMCVFAYKKLDEADPLTWALSLRKSSGQNASCLHVVMTRTNDGEFRVKDASQLGFGGGALRIRTRKGNHSYLGVPEVEPRSSAGTMRD